MSKLKTPLRYPGGKQRLAPFVEKVVKSVQEAPGDYCEPFAGGAGVAVQLLLSDAVAKIHLNDLSFPVYSFWRTVVSQTEELCRRVSRASLNIDEWQKQRAIQNHPKDHSQIDLGFSFFYLNRCNRSGIPSAGPIGGYAQNGVWKLDARFPKDELIRRIEMVASRRKDIVVKNMDAEEFISEYVSRLPSNALVYADPPYFHKAERLYLNHYVPADHERLARVIQRKVKCHWIVSYDVVEEVVKHYSKRKKIIYKIQYNAAKAYKGREVIFFSDGINVPKNSGLSLSR